MTLGSSTRKPDEFLHLLKQHEIDRVVDVRRFPTSRFEHFKRENLKRLLEESQFKYTYLGDRLGGYRSGGYQKYATTPDFKSAVDTLEELASDSKTAIMCAEKLPWRCHRRYISLELESRGWKVLHIIDEGRVWIPKGRSQIPNPNNTDTWLVDVGLRRGGPVNPACSGTQGLTPLWPPGTLTPGRKRED